jgi:IS1 family transposase
MRGIERATGVSRNTLAKWLKKRPDDAEGDALLLDYLEATLLPPQVNEILELDELWSFVGSKQHSCWIWIALCRRTRQVVAWHPGDRSLRFCRALWDKIPSAYKQGLIFSDFWEAYESMVPKEQHRACGKEEGQTNHVERFNLTLRQRVGRLTRRTLSFSKPLLWHYRHIRHFLVQYNLHQRNRYINSTS